jgi:serine/threonine-protein kinase RsbW
MATDSTSQIFIQAKLEKLRDVTHWVGRLATDYQLPAALVHRIDVCLTELVTNVISYGYPDGRTGAVKLQFWRQADKIVIRIDDDGIVFDPSSYELPGLLNSLADAPVGGRGIRLVRHFSDDLHHRAQTTGNQLTLVFHAAAVGAPSAAAESDGGLS